MKIQVASFSSTGGAGNVGRHLTYGFQQLGLDASFYSAMESNLRAESLKIPLVTAAAGFDNYIAKSKDWPSLVSLTRDRVKLPLPLDDDTDALILRWGNGFLNQGLINKLGNRTLVLGLDDMNYFTGACHYAGDCIGFHKDCSNCPCVKAPFRKLVQENLERKKRLLGQVRNLKVVAPTQWIKEEFERSSLSDLAEAKLISNPLNPLYFRDQSSQERGPWTAKKEGLRVVIVAANLGDPVKGVEAIWPYLEELVRDKRISLSLVGAGSTELRNKMPGGHFLGSLEPKEQIQLYRNTDLLLVPSLQENAGTVVAEAATQGVPAVARRVGGLISEVEHAHGWLFDNEEELLELLNNISRELIWQTSTERIEWAISLSPLKVAEQYTENVLRN